MYPITPATSASHYLSDVFEKVGGLVHQAEDEIAACAFAIGASYTGKCAVTITSGPGYSLKQEAIGLAVMARDSARRRQRAARRSEHRPADEDRTGRLLTVDVRQSRRRTESGDGPEHDRRVLLLDDHRAQDRRDVQHGGRGVVGREPRHGAAAVPAAAVQPEWLAPPIDQNPVPEGAKPYDWDATPGLSRRFGPASRTACTRSRASRTIARAASPTTRKSTSKACMRAASSSRRCRRR